MSDVPRLIRSRATTVRLVRKARRKHPPLTRKGLKKERLVTSFLSGLRLKSIAGTESRGTRRSSSILATQLSQPTSTMSRKSLEASTESPVGRSSDSLTATP